ncbi:putative phytosulfokines 6 isoform X1 [Telopea speciosissima]|uniref:putative phytosulfokines 6 isoform X1 n=1 Tax=Telopea speciosissima TaxID=54955 RepID=UPI001CC36413|nr:putative phytosulfokines 6 isoform X1 [Telopea speciosissima]
MRQSSSPHLHLFLFLFLIFSYSTVAARLLTAKQGEEKVKAVKIVQSGPLRTEEMDDSWNKVIRMGDCGNGDEECLKRRMVAEAHLDYIYTQNHKP